MSDADGTGVSAGDATAGVRTVDAGRGRVAYAEYGDPEGVPVLVFHGTPGSRLLGGLYDEAAREHGVRLLAVDRPGYGASDHWPDRTLATTGVFAAPVLADAGVDSAGVVGFSGGGPHALAFAASHPGCVRRVDLVAGATPPDCGPEEARAQRLLVGLADRAPWLLARLLGVQVWLARRRPSVVLGQYTSGDADAELTTFETDHLRTLLSSRAAVLDRQATAGREARRRA